MTNSLYKSNKSQFVKTINSKPQSTAERLHSSLCSVDPVRISTHRHPGMQQQNSH